MFRLNSTGMFDIHWLKDTIFILTDDKGKSLDLANAAREGEREIIIYTRNMRMNQRWRFQVIEEREQFPGKAGLRVHIVSALSEMYLVRAHHEGLMQASYPEEWLIEETEIKEYIFIRHAKDG